MLSFLRKRSETARDLLVLVAVHVVHCLDLYRPGAFLFARDNIHNYLPVRAILFHRLRDGGLPLWNPYLYMGVPYLADPVNGVLYPPHWLFALSYDFRLMTTLIVALHYLAAELFMYGFLRSLKLSRYAAIGGAAVYMASGYLSMETTAHQFLYAHAWLPAFAWCVNLHLGGARRGLPLAVACGAMMLFAGEPQTLFLALAAACPLVLWQGREKPVTAVVSSLLLGLLPLVLYLPILLPMSDFARESARAHLGSVAGAIQWSFHPLRFLELLAPNLFGRSIGALTFWAEKPGGVFEGGFYTDSAYLGAAAIPLVTGVLCSGASRRRELVFWTALAVAGFLLAMGQHLPFYRWLYQALPGWNLFRYPERLLILPTFALPAALALSLDELKSGKRRWAVVALLASAAVLAALAWSPWNEWLAGLGSGAFRFTAPVLIGGSAKHGLVAVVLMTELLWLRNALTQEQFLAAAVSLFLCDTLAASRAPMMTLDAGYFQNTPLAVQMLGPGRGRQGPVLHVSDQPTIGAFAFMPGEIEQTSGRLLRHELLDRTILSWESMESGLGAVYLYATPSGPSDNSYNYALYRLRNELPEFTFDRLVGLGLMTATADGRIRAAGWQPVGRASLSGLQVFRSPYYAGPVVCPARSETLPGMDAVIERTKAKGFSPETVALFPEPGPPNVVDLQGDAGPAGDTAGVPGPAEKCAVQKWEPEQVTIQTADSRPRWMVYRRAWSSGWNATLDGRPVQMRLAWGLFPSVELPAGAHEVVLSYEPGKAWIGLQIGVVAWTAWIGWMVYLLSRPRRRPGNGRKNGDGGNQ